MRPPRKTMAFLRDLRSAQASPRLDQRRHFLTVRGGDNPVQSDGAIVLCLVEQAMNESGIKLSIHRGAVVTVVVDGITVGEVNLEHGAKALHDRLRIVAAKNLAQA